MRKKSLFLREFELETDERLARYYKKPIKLLITKIKLRMVRNAMSRQYQKERRKKHGSKIR